MSEDFTWQPDLSARRRSAIRVAVVLACASVGIAAGSYYPLKTVITAFQRANPPRVAAKETLPAHPAQDGSRASFTPAADAPPLASTEPNHALQESTARVVLLNPGSVAPPDPAEAQPTRSLNVDQKAPPRRPLAKGVRTGDRSVLVVVRRRGPPYDTKVLSGRIQNGHLIVNAPGIALR